VQSLLLQQVPRKHCPPQHICPAPQVCVASQATQLFVVVSQTCVPLLPVGVPHVPAVRHCTQRLADGSHAFEAQSASLQHSAPRARGGPPVAMHPPPQQVLPAAHGAVVLSQLPQERLAKLHARCLGSVAPSQAALFVALGQQAPAPRHVAPSVGSLQHD
jgi:hypothetical protein